MEAEEGEKEIQENIGNSIGNVDLPANLRQKLVRSLSADEILVLSTVIAPYTSSSPLFFRIGCTTMLIPSPHIKIKS